MADWTINNIRIYVTELRTTIQQHIARLDPLGGGTTIQRFGYSDPIKEMKCVVVGSGNMEALEVLPTSGGYYEINSPYGILGNYHVEALEYDISRTWRQTVDKAQSDEAPVYLVTMSLHKEV